MDLDAQITPAKALIKRREEIDRQLAELFGGALPAPSERKERKCKVCGEPGHRSAACPTRNTGDRNGATNVKILLSLSWSKERILSAPILARPPALPPLRPSAGAVSEVPPFVPRARGRRGRPFRSGIDRMTQ